MATSPNLGITHLTQAQNQKHVTVNDAIDALDNAFTDHRTDLSFPADANYEPTGSIITASYSIDVGSDTDLTVTRDFIIPDTSKSFLIENSTTGDQTIRVIRTSGGTGIYIANGDRKLLFCDGTNVLLATGESPYEMGGFIPGTPAISTMIYKVVVARTVTFPDEFVGAQGHAETAPSGGSVVFEIKKNGSPIGTMTFASAADTSTFATTATVPEVLDAGDRFEVHTPGNMNAIADISFMFTGTR
jgi:hypothetical protein